MTRTYNIYCDESCHLEHDDIPVMVLGGVWCRSEESRNIAEEIRAIKAKHGLSPQFEIKWTKVSPAKLDFYREVIDCFLADDRMRFRGLLVRDKGKLDHDGFSQTHDEWYYKMYYLMLRFVINSPNHYRVYLDIKDTQGGDRTRKLHDVLANSFYDFDHECIERVQQVRSHEVEILQISDLLIGAISYLNRNLETSAAKAALVDQLNASPAVRSLTANSPFSARKFNLFVWDPQEAVE